MAQPVMTVLEARIAPEQWAAFEQAYRGGQIPPQMLQAFLVQSATDRAVWRAVSIWRSREALDEYRRSVEAPAGILFFRSVGAEPTLSVFEVIDHQMAATS